MDLASSLSNAASLIAVVGFIYVIWKWVSASYRKTLGSRRALSRSIRHLAIGETIGYVNSLLGQPVMEKPIYEKTRQLIYWAKHAWISVIVDENESSSVQAFSITVVDPRLIISTDVFSNGKLNTHLGRSHYTSMNSNPNSWRLFVGARILEYAEGHYFGNPGHYQTYVLATIQAGIGAFDLTSSDSCASNLTAGKIFGASEATYKEASKDVQNFRCRNIPNTLIVLGSKSANDLMPRWNPIAISVDQVRTFLPYRQIMEHTTIIGRCLRLCSRMLSNRG